MKVKITQYVRSEPYCEPFRQVFAGQIVDARMNHYGAVSAVMEHNELLGLKPDEFEVVEKPAFEEWWAVVKRIAGYKYGFADTDHFDKAAWKEYHYDNDYCSPDEAIQMDLGAE